MELSGGRELNVSSSERLPGCSGTAGSENVPGDNENDITRNHACGSLVAGWFKDAVSREKPQRRERLVVDNQWLRRGLRPT